MRTLKEKKVNTCLNKGIPKAVYDLQQIVRKSSGLLIATPEYNGTFSSILKNAFDWLSRSYELYGGESPLK